MDDATPPHGTYRLGRLDLSVSGGGAVCRAVQEELAPLAVTGGTRSTGGTDGTDVTGGGARGGAAPAAAGAAVRTRFVDALADLPGGRSYKPVVVGDRGAYQVRVPHHLFDYGVAYDGATTDLTVAPHPVSQGSFAAGLARWRDWNYLTYEQEASKNFFYQVFDHVVQEAQLPLDQSWIHAGAVERDGRAVLLTGWGGVGKTTAMLKLVLEEGWRFLSDDLGLVTADGQVHRGPKKLQVYGYNLLGEPRLAEHLLGRRDLLDRSSWQYKLRRRGPTGVRRRVSAEELLGDHAVADQAAIDVVLLLERGDVPAARHAEVGLEEFAARSASTVMRELDPFATVSAAYHSAGVDPALPHLPTYARVTRRTEDVLRRACAGRTVVQVTLPRAATPTDVLREVKAYL